MPHQISWRSEFLATLAYLWGPDYRHDAFCACANRNLASVCSFLKEDSFASFEDFETAFQIYKEQKVNDKTKEQFFKDVIAFYQGACTCLNSSVLLTELPVWCHAEFLTGDDLLF